MSLTLAQFRERLQALKGDGLRRVVRPEMVAAAARVERRGKSNFRALFHTSTGQHLNAISAQALEQDLGIRARSAGRGGRLKELGGTVRPKNGKMLRIPLAAARTGAGADRFATPLRQTAPPDFFRFVRTPRGAFLVHDVGGIGKSGRLLAGSRTEFWYILKPSVTFQPKPYLRPALQAEANELPGRLFRRLVRAIRTGEAA